MKNRLMLLGTAAALLVLPIAAQNAQTPTQMSIPEFRQVLVDLGTYLDSHKGTNLASQFSAATDDTLTKVYPAVTNLAQLQAAVAALKQHDAAVASGATLTIRKQLTRASILPNAVVGNCPPDTIIDNSPGATCTPAYPDPTNTAWQNLVNPLITFGAFSPTDYPSVSSQSCGLTVESNLSQVSSALQGAVLAASSICSAAEERRLLVTGRGPMHRGSGSGIDGVLAVGSRCAPTSGNRSSSRADARFWFPPDCSASASRSS